MTRLVGWVFAGLVLAPFGLAAQSEELRSLRRVTTDEGLSHQMVLDVAEDSTGFMWIATRGGLDRWDGQEFVSYRASPNDTTTISTDIAWSVLVDASGTIWVGTIGGGLNRIDPVTGRFEHFRHDPGDPRSLGHDSVRELFVDSQGRLWIGTEGGGLSRLDPGADDFLRFESRADAPTSLSSNNVWTVHESADGRIWVGTATGLDAFVEATQEFERHDFLGSIRAIAEAPGGALWLGGQSRGLIRFDPANGREIGSLTHDPRDSTSLSSNAVYGLLPDAEGGLWIATFDAGLNLLDASGRVTRVPTIPHGDGGLPAHSVFCIERDRSGRLWICTSEGLAFTDPSAKPFENVVPREAGLAPEMAFTTVNALHESADGDLWVGTRGGGLHRYRDGGELVRTFRRMDGPPGSITSDLVRAIAEDGGGRIWVGTMEGGVSRFDPASNRWTGYRHDPRDAGSLAEDWVQAVFVDSSGNLWAGTRASGLDRLRPGATSFDHLRHREDDPTSLNHDAIWAIAEDESGTLWVGTGNGMNELDPSGRVVRSFLPDRADSTSLRGTVVQVVHPAGDILWVGTDQGLNRLDRRTGTFRSWTYADGLPSGDVIGILEDTRGNLWLSTARGLARFDPTTEMITAFGPGDGLPTRAFALNAFASMADGRLVFGHTEGFTRFDPDDIADDPSTPRVVLTDLFLDRSLTRVGTGSVLTEALSQTDTLRLGARVGTVTVQFAVIDFSGGGPSEVRYRLGGQDADWVLGDASTRDATYTNLRPGAYTFEVAAANSAGTWGASESLEVFVATPWTATLWFRVSLAMLVFGGAYLTHRRRLHAGEMHARELEGAVQARTSEVVRQKQEIESRHSRLQEAQRELAVAKDEAERANRVRNVFLATVSHELRTPLHAVNGFSQLLEKAKGLDDEQRLHAHAIGEAGSRLLGIVDDILEMAEIEARRVSSRLELFEPARLLDQIRSHLSVRSAERGVGLAMDIEDTFPMLIEADLANLGRVMERLVANAITRSPSGSEVKLRMNGESHGNGIQVNVLISDEGPSIEPSEHENIFEPFRSFDPKRPSPEGAGLGLPISRRLARLMRGDVTVASVQGGATFTLSFPATSPTGPPRVSERRGDARLSDAVFRERVRQFIASLPDELRGGLEGALRQGDIDGFLDLLTSVPEGGTAEVRWLRGQAELFQVEALLGMFPDEQPTTP